MKVLFSPCGVGLGHAGRCIPLAHKLAEKGVQLLFSTYKDAVQYVKQEGFSVVKVPPLGFRVKPDGTVDFRQTAANPGPFFASFTLMRQINAEIRVMKSFKPDVVVSDSRISPLIAAKLLGIPRVCILNQFQIIIPRRKKFLRLAKLADAGTLAIIGKIWTSGMHVLIPDLPPPYVISLGNLRIPKAYRKRVRLIGPILPVYPQELPSKEEIRQKLGFNGGDPLIFAPVSGPVKERSFLIGILRKIFLNFPKDYQIVMSLGYPNTSTNPIKKGNLTIFKWVSNRFELLKACDLVISRAGHGTLLQSICYGKPMILIPTPSHTEQLNNAEKAVELGIAEKIDQGELSRQMLLSRVEKILGDSAMRRKVEEIQKEVLKLNGLETAVQTIMRVAEKGGFNNISS
ncbi:MAG: glycosyltransferase [Candidatus Bathyarchaeia archaeon]